MSLTSQAQVTTVSSKSPKKLGSIDGLEQVYCCCDLSYSVTPSSTRVQSYAAARNVWTRPWQLKFHLE